MATPPTTNPETYVKGVGRKRPGARFIGGDDIFLGVGGSTIKLGRAANVENSDVCGVYRSRALKNAEEDRLSLRGCITPVIGRRDGLIILQQPPIIAATAPSELFELPLESSVFNIEFNTGDLSSGFGDGTIGVWQGFGNLDLTQPPTISTGFSTPDLIKASLDNRRRSTLVFQPSSDMPGTIPQDSGSNNYDHGGIYYRHTGELPDGTYWMRGGGMIRRAGNSTENDGTMEFCLAGWDEINLVPSHFNGVRWRTPDVDFAGNDTEWEVKIHNNNDGPGEPSSTSATFQNEGNQMEYFAITKISNSYIAWIAGPSGGWIRFSAKTYTGSEVIECICLEGMNQLSNDPFNMIYYCDFIRYIPLNGSGEIVLP